MATAWPASDEGPPVQRVVLEADCDGGVLGSRYQFGVDPGTVSMVAACRRAAGAPDPAEHGRRIADDVYVVPGPEVSERALSVWRTGAPDVAARLADDQRIWVVDGGRIGPESVLQPIVASSRLVIVVSGSSVEDLVRVPARVAQFKSLGVSITVGVLVVGKPAQNMDELRSFFGSDSVWVGPAPDDMRSITAACIAGGRARRSVVWRAATDLGSELAGVGR